MKLNKPILIIIIFIITLLVIFLFVVPKYKEVAGLQNSLAEKQAEYDSKSAYYAKIQEIIENIKSKKEGLSKIDSALPSDSYLSSLVYFFQKKGTEAGLTISTMVLSQASASVQNKNIKDIAFNIRASGTYAGFKDFLSSLDKSARLFEVSSVSFSGFGAAKPEIQQTYEFNMEVHTHAY